MDALAALINDTWDRRAEIEPSYRVPKALKLLDVYRLLPGGNCRACGEATCLAFAGKLAKGEAEIGACAPLFAPDQQNKREQLLQMVADGGA
jgi:ArsR family metal-binding transcriptional regulator